MQKSGGKIKVFLREIAPYVSIIQPFQILNGRFQNLLNKALRKSWMLGFFFYQIIQFTLHKQTKSIQYRN